MFFNMIYDNLGILLFLFMAVITVLALIRSLIKIKKEKLSILRQSEFSMTCLRV